MKRYSFLILLILFYCCAPAAKTWYGIKSPQLQTVNSLNVFLYERRIDSSKNLIFKDLKSFATASQHGLLTFPDAMFYNKNGYRVDYKKSADDCNAGVDTFIRDLKNFNSIEPDKLHRIDNLIELTSNKLHVNLDADVIVIITWATYIGKLNRTKAFEWIKLLEKANSDSLRVDYYLLNCDYQETWNLSPALKKKFQIKG